MKTTTWIEVETGTAYNNPPYRYFIVANRVEEFRIGSGPFLSERRIVEMIFFTKSEYADINHIKA